MKQEPTPDEVIRVLKLLNKRWSKDTRIDYLLKVYSSKR